MIWSPFGLLFNFSPPIDFCYPLSGIKVLGIMFGSTSLSSSFLWDAIHKVIRHVKVISRLGDVQVVFGIFFRCFAHKPSYLFHCFPPLLVF
jgi:hypothetical protein